MAMRNASRATRGEERLRTAAGGSAGSGAVPDATDEAVGDRIADLEQQLRDAGERLRETARDLGAIASDQMRRHPMAAFGVAFVAGMTLARLLRR